MRDVRAFVRDFWTATMGMEPAVHSYRRQFDRRRFISPGVAFLFVVVIGFASVGFWKVQAVQSQTIASLRDGCEGVNALRVNQAIGISDQIVQTERALKGSLGSLEEFRAQVVAGLAQRRRNLARLRSSVADHPLKGRAALRYPAKERPYREDCEASYP